MDYEVVTSVRIDCGPCWQWDALAKYRRPEVEVLDKLLDVDAELTELRGHGGAGHTHLGRDVGPQAADVMLDLDGGRLLELRGLGGHGGDNKGFCLSHWAALVCQCCQCRGAALELTAQFADTLYSL